MGNRKTKSSFKYAISPEHCILDDVNDATCEHLRKTGLQTTINLIWCHHHTEPVREHLAGHVNLDIQSVLSNLVSTVLEFSVLHLGLPLFPILNQPPNTVSYSYTLLCSYAKGGSRQEGSF
jgi:hypothetical protein